jgi:hypothetical protein
VLERRISLGASREAQKSGQTASRSSLLDLSTIRPPRRIHKPTLAFARITPTCPKQVNPIGIYDFDTDRLRLIAPTDVAPHRPRLTQCADLSQLPQRRDAWRIEPQTRARHS